MKWRRRRDADQNPTGPSPADEAVERSRRQLDAARAENERWGRVAERLRKVREANHLAEAFEQAFGEGR